ncbi:MAG: hypothetical protein JXR84_16760 [Anaerolineae bacterium]|nr:hypothetical protein [Anaerolineae bacterium]
MGTTAYAEVDGLDVETWWRVTDGPITRLFSIMAHLLTPQGDLIDQADGLVVWPSVLATGDVFVQRHHFALSHEGDAVWLRTGAYWLDTLGQSWMGRVAAWGVVGKHHMVGISRLFPTGRGRMNCWVRPHP